MRAYKLSIVCGITPLLIGTSTFVLWVFTRWTIFERIGVFTLIGGLVLFCIGAMGLAIHTIGRCKSGGDRSGLLRENTRAAGILILNFPAALFIMFLVSYISSYYTLIVQNDSPHQVANFVIDATGTKIVVGNIPPRRSVRKSFKVGEGSIRFSTLVNKKVLEGTIEGYVSGSGVKKVLTIRRDQTYSVNEY